MALTKQQKGDQLRLGEAIENNKIHDEGVTGPELNIGPDMSRGDKANKKAQNTRSLLELNAPSPSERAEMMDARNIGSNWAKRGAAEDKISPSYKKGGKVSSASSRADGCAQRGKTKGRIV